MIKKNKLNIFPIDKTLVSRAEQEQSLQQRGCVFWFTGLSGSGKSTIAAAAQRKLYDQKYTVKVLDGDDLRAGINANLGFTEADRTENIRRTAAVAKLFVETGIITIVTTISPLRVIREAAKQTIGAADFKEIYISTPLATCETRDVKGLYKKARAGEIPQFTGISAPYELPENADLVLNTDEYNIEDCATQILDFILKTIKKDI